MNIFSKVIAVIMVVMAFSSISAMAEGDLESGLSIFNKKCKVCHTAAKGEDAKVGPNLFGIYNEKAGQYEGYQYSKGLIEANLTWDDATLDAYLLKPRDVVTRGKMIFAGLRKEQERQDMIAYLKSLKD